MANGLGDSVTELDAATGSLASVIEGPAFGLDRPSSISSDGTHVWVANPASNSVTELNASNGALSGDLRLPLRLPPPRQHCLRRHPCLGGQLRVQLGHRAERLKRFPGRGALRLPLRFPPPRQHFLRRHPCVGGQSRVNSVTELNASSGSLVTVISRGAAHFAVPDAISSDGAHVWVVNGGVRISSSPLASPSGQSVTELEADTGAVVRSIAGPATGLDQPSAISSDGAHVWVANYSNQTVTEFEASTGSVVAVQGKNPFGFEDPIGITTRLGHVWVVNQAGNSVTELDAAPAGS